MNSSAWNHFFALSATRSASEEGAETAVDLPHSREWTKEPTSALRNYGSKGKLGATASRAELQNILQENIEVEVIPVVDLIAYNSFFLWAMQHR